MKPLINRPIRWLPRPQFSLFLWVLWLFLVESLNPAQILMGGILAWAIPFLTQQFWPEKPTVHNTGRLGLYLLALLRDILHSNLVVAWRILRGPRHLSPGFINFPLELEDEFAITVLASTISLTPGTVSANVSGDRKTLLIHALHVDDEQAMIADIKARYETPLKEIFGCSPSSS